MSGKSVLITGANKGLGLEFVKQFINTSPPPKHIIAVCRAPDKAEELRKIAAANPSVYILRLEITDTSQYDRAVDEVRKIIGTSGLNLLLNNAGMYGEKSVDSLEDHTKEVLTEFFEVNTITPILLTKAFLPLLKEAVSKSAGEDGEKDGDEVEEGVCSGKGVCAAVVNVTAILACFHSTGLHCGAYPYKYSKAALNMATHCLAEDLKPSGILVMAIHPGWVRTDTGGPDAYLSPEESVSGCMEVLTSLTEKRRGKLYNWKGEELAY